MTGLIHPRLFETLTGTFFDNTCTITPPVEAQNEYGEPATTYPAPLSADYTDIPCTVAPAGGSERRTPVQVYAESTHSISLTGYYPLIQTRYRATDGDGVDYDILGVEHDSQLQHTLLHTRIVVV